MEQQEALVELEEMMWSFNTETKAAEEKLETTVSIYKPS